jgi:hypothetical protein
MINVLIILVVDTDDAGIVAVVKAILVNAFAVLPAKSVKKDPEAVERKGFISNDVVELLSNVHRIFATVPSL